MAKKSVFVSGLFNVLHPGHFRFLDFAKRQGVRLTVGIIKEEGKNTITLSDEERLKNIQSLSFVDTALIVEGTLVETIEKLKPDVVVKGWEYRDQNNVECSALSKYGGELIFSPNDMSVVIDEKLHTEVNSPIPNIWKDTSSFRTRRGSNHANLSRTINNFANLNVCVIGDTIIDNYVDCAAVGMSREDHCVVLKPERSTKYLGGAAIVASHARALGAKVDFFSVAGFDDNADFCSSGLENLGATCNIIQDNSRPTTEKTRFRVDDKTVSRVNKFSDHDISKEIQNRLIVEFERELLGYDLVIFSDFGLGATPKWMASQLIEMCNSIQIFTGADSQSSSQLGDLSKFKGVQLVCPTEYEARLTVNDMQSGLVEITKKIQVRLGVSNIVLTLGRNGILISQFSLNGDESQQSFENDTLPSLNRSPLDVSGAGDAFFVTSCMSLCLGQTVWDASLIGSVAAALQISKLGNVPMQRYELLEALQG